MGIEFATVEFLPVGDGILLDGHFHGLDDHFMALVEVGVNTTQVMVAVVFTHTQAEVLE